jgi:hypothetical protein
VTVYASLLVAIVGALVWALAVQSAKAAYLGLIMFACGLLVFLFQLGPYLKTVFP